MEKKQIEQNDDYSEDNVPKTVWDFVRYALILIVLGVGLWYYCFRKETIFLDHQFEGETMGTSYLVKVHDFPTHSSKTGNWETLVEEIKKRITEVDQAMSTYKNDSDISTFNVSESTDWFDVSKDTATVVELALEISKLTDGAFDITVAPIVDLWGFGPKSPSFSAAELEAKSNELKEQIGYEKLEVRLDPPALKKERPDLTIDLSAIAKGYGVDTVGELLESKKINNYMVEIGGEVRCRGNKGIKGSWAIGIERPLLLPPGSPAFPGLQRRIFLKDQSLATSGDYQNYRSVDGVKYSHIIDPRTGFPTEKITQGENTPEYRLGSVSVLEKNCIRADALATALFVLGPNKGLELAESQGLPVLFLLRSQSEDPTRANIVERASVTFPKPDSEQEKK